MVTPSEITQQAIDAWTSLLNAERTSNQENELLTQQEQRLDKRIEELANSLNGFVTIVDRAQQQLVKPASGRKSKPQSRS